MNTKHILRKLLLQESSITRAADTNEQEEALATVEEWAKKHNIIIRLGTKIGRYPQTVILDIKYQDNAIYIRPDGSIKVFGTEISSYIDDDAEELFLNAIYAKYPETKK